MSDNIDNTATGGNTTPAQGDKTFTQEQLNAIVGERLAKEKAKGEAALADREKELAARELRISAKEMLTERGLPVELYEAINATDKETLEKSLKIIQEAFTKAKGERAAITIKGAVPGQGSDDIQDSGDTAIRKAMGLLQ